MRLCATSDLHGYLPEIPECDVLVIAGDVCPHYDHDRNFQKFWLKTSFTNWLRKVPAKRIIGIGGNHDLIFEFDPDVPRSLPWTYLKDSGVTIDGISFWGSPWSPGDPEISMWGFHKLDLTEEVWKCPNGTDIIISHGPPHMLCDSTGPQFRDEHAGEPEWNRLIEAYQPDMFICGHIHHAFGWDEVKHPAGNVTRICNVTYCDDPPAYKPWRKPPVFLVDDEHIRVEGAYELFPDPLTDFDIPASLRDK
jgi:Icc-related predicted phosphoesterase